MMWFLHSFLGLTEYPFLIATPSIVTVEATSSLSTWVPREGLASVPPPSSTARDPSLVLLMTSVLPTTSRVAVMSISTLTSISQVVSESQFSIAFFNPASSETLVVVTVKKRWGSISCSREFEREFGREFGREKGLLCLCLCLC